MSSAVPEILFKGALADDYHLLMRICPAAAEMSQRVGRFVADWRPTYAHEGLTVLEIGCGTGITTAHLLASRPDLTLRAIDNAPAMLRQARRNLSDHFESGRLQLDEVDALTALKALPEASLDLVASGYAIHNFLEGYRRQVLEAIFRALKPGGVLVNGDRYGLDDSEEHLRTLQQEVQVWFSVFGEMNRPDLLEQWVIHLLSDESLSHRMDLKPSLELMASIGYREVSATRFPGVNALVIGQRP